ncbi:carbohydrate ABC transporter permease [Paenibacillus cymbidii]|uniref:carbohydrate ABC transporter permease n=1 Tax=Paenibacillus cymbidii TaxID=1639034 RepID=UPI001F492362|nr:carbohydrate ABC transporter permease [Paenibacillus cymbidii]
MKIKAFDIVNIMLLLLLSLSIMAPFLLLLNQSLMTSDDILKYGYTFIPKHIVADAYQYLLVEETFVWKGFAVTLFVAAAGTFLSLLFTSSLAYGLSKKYLPYRGPLTIFVLVTMFFSGGLIPSYLLLTNLGLKDSLWVLIIPVLISQWNMFLMRNFFMELPGEIEESASIDGANQVTILFRVILPISLPVLATIGLFYAVAYWNSWFTASIYIHSQHKWPLQLILRQMIVSLDVTTMAGASEGGGSRSDTLLENVPKEAVKAATIMISSLPIMCVYPFIQKYFVKGITVGSLKG